MICGFIDLFKKELKQIICKRYPDLRYGHSACIAGDFLVLYGGMNEMGEVLNDIWVFNFLTHTWMKVVIAETN